MPIFGQVAVLPKRYKMVLRLLLIAKGNKKTNSAGLLKQLHWLPIEWRIKLKIACITYKTISTTQPALPLFIPETLHSIFIPCVGLSLNCCSFPVSAHVLVLAASLLPLQLFGTPFLGAIRSSVSTHSFRRQLKTFFYNS